MKRILFAFLCGLSLASCDLDLLHRGERRVAGTYELSKSESGNYYLVREQDADKSGTGVVEGTVTQIGWNDKFIMVERKASFGGDKDGWMIIAITNESMVGPFTGDEVKSHPEVAGIHPMPPREAWNRADRRWFRWTRSKFPVRPSGSAPQKL
jgi:hypothetical protein